MSKKNRKLSYFAVLALTFAPYFLAPSKFRPLRFVVSHSAEPPKQFFVLLRKKSRKMARGLEEALDSLQKACFALAPFSSLIKPSAKRQRIALARRVLEIVAGAKKNGYSKYVCPKATHSRGRAHYVAHFQKIPFSGGISSLTSYSLYSSLYLPMRVSN